MALIGMGNGFLKIIEAHPHPMISTCPLVMTRVNLMLRDDVLNSV